MIGYCTMECYYHIECTPVQPLHLTARPRTLQPVVQRYITKVFERGCHLFSVCADKLGHWKAEFSEKACIFYMPCKIHVPSNAFHQHRRSFIYIDPEIFSVGTADANKRFAFSSG